MKWSRALEWVNKNLLLMTRLDKASDTLITTTRVTFLASAAPVFQITKKPARKGRYYIEFEGSCENLFGCHPPVTVWKAFFANFVMERDE